MRVNGNTMQFRPGPHAEDFEHLATPGEWLRLRLPGAVFSELMAAYKPEAARVRGVAIVFDPDHLIVQFQEMGRAPEGEAYWTAAGGLDIAFPGSRIPECFKEIP